MLQHETAGDYILATGEPHSVQDFLSIAFSHVGLDWTRWVETDPSLVRPVDVGRLVGDPYLAKSVLGWRPEVPFPRLVTMMVDAQLRKLQGSGK
jgi:GDPmannose 4,6-dehydratase